MLNVAAQKEAPKTPKKMLGAHSHGSSSQESGLSVSSSGDDLDIPASASSFSTQYYSVLVYVRYIS